MIEDECNVKKTIVELQSRCLQKVTTETAQLDRLAPYRHQNKSSAQYKSIQISSNANTNH